MVHRDAAIAGTGFTAITKKSGRSVLDLATEACRAAVEDAGLPLADVDGIGSFMVLGDSVPSEAVATALALPQTRYVMDFQQGGQSPAWVVANAAMAVSQGYADNVVVFRALNGRSGVRVGSSAFLGGAGQFRLERFHQSRVPRGKGTASCPQWRDLPSAKFDRGDPRGKSVR